MYFSAVLGLTAVWKSTIVAEENFSDFVTGWSFPDSMSVEAISWPVRHWCNRRSERT